MLRRLFYIVTLSSIHSAATAATNTVVMSETFAANGSFNETLSAADDSFEASVAARNSFNATALKTLDVTLSDNRSIEGNVRFVMKRLRFSRLVSSRMRVGSKDFRLEFISQHNLIMLLYRL